MLTKDDEVLIIERWIEGRISDHNFIEAIKTHQFSKKVAKELMV